MSQKSRRAPSCIWRFPDAVVTCPKAALLMFVEMPPSVWRLRAFKNSKRNESCTFSVILLLLCNARSSFRAGSERTWLYRLADVPRASGAGAENAALFRYVSCGDDVLDSSKFDFRKFGFIRSPTATFGRLLPPFQPLESAAGAVNGPRGVPE